MADPNATTCAACGASGELHEHHLVARIDDGKNLPSVMLCVTCHGVVHGRRFAMNHAELTRRGIAAARARGAKIGNPRLRPGNRELAAIATRAKQAQSRKKAAEIFPYVEAARKAGCTTLQQIAEALTARGVRTPGGCDRWSAEQVRRVIKRTQDRP